MIKHIVAWNFAADVADKVAAGQKVKEGLEGLKSQIDEIVSISVHIDQLGTSDREIVLYSEFKTEGCLQAYQVHPAHVEVAALVRSVTADRVCLDYL